MRQRQNESTVKEGAGVEWLRQDGGKVDVEVGWEHISSNKLASQLRSTSQGC
jgi:hypothetical protein